MKFKIETSPMPGEPFAIVVDRVPGSDGPELAVWNGTRYQFSNGDCCDREGDSLNGIPAEWLTHYQIEQRLLGKVDPVAWRYKEFDPEEQLYSQVWKITQNREHMLIYLWHGAIVVPLVPGVGYEAPDPDASVLMSNKD